MAETEFAQWDGIQTAEMIRSGEVSSREVTDAAIERAETLDPELRFLVTDDFDRARERAGHELGDGVFAGVPTLIKDLDDLIGLPTRSGSRLTERRPIATRQMPFVDGLLAAGLNPIGKSATPEFGFLPTTEPLAFPPTRNPWNPAHSAGGSSGGAAAAVAAGVVPFAHASDGGGSIRIPASCCGLFGLKPSRGRTLATDAGPFPLPLSAQLCVSRSVRDSAALLKAVEGEANGLKPLGSLDRPSQRRLRIGMVIDSPNGVPADDVAGAVKTMAHRLEALGHPIEPTRWPDEIAAMNDAFLLIWSQGAVTMLEEIAKVRPVPIRPEEIEPFTHAMTAIVRMAPEGAVDQALARLTSLADPYARWLERYDVILSPVLSLPPPEIGWLAPDLPVETMAERLPRYVGYTTPYNVVGAPAMSVPGAFSRDGLPIGVQFGAAVGDEATLLALAYELETAHPWADRKPERYAS